MPAIAGKRGCGTRVAGGVYAECGLSPIGLPITAFIIDPPTPIVPEQIGLSPIGVTLIERDGVTHVMDWVGSSHYPNVADFVEEVRRMGLSRRLPKTLDFSRLTRESKHILVHARAYIGNHEPYRQQLLADAPPCPKRNDQLPHVVSMCARLWWQDVDPIKQEVAHDLDADRGPFTRELPGFHYTAWTRPVDVEEPRYEPAIFLALPIERLAVIRDDAGGTHEKALEAAGAARLPVVLEDE